jgi:D-alanine-D-alanine ligase
MLAKGIREMAAQYGSLLIEQYINGREFNISLLEDEKGDPEVLPPAEIIFNNWPQGKPKIVNYNAKWDDRSFEYNNTVRSFPLPDDPAVRAVSDTALRCWVLFGLRGYARVDMRVDDKHGVHVIEINANPCISPDAGFMAATACASLLPEEVIERILNAALRSVRHNVRQ